ncbi:MAG: TetR/AcrR family transcriptional regulator [Ilumatobacteraceae bacterium]|nr:TetR/AcrR family transcriptional regulator [Ilumatobacteraceae bacterium]
MRPISTELGDKMRVTAEVFAEHGFDGATISAISKATGVPTSTIYYNFDGKLEILAFLLRAWLNRTSVVVQEAVAGADSAAVRLARLIDAHMYSMAHDPSTFQVLFAEQGRIGRLPDVSDAVQEVFHRPLAELLVQGAADGSLKDVTVETATSVIYGAVTFSGLRRIVTSDGAVPAFDPGLVSAEVGEIVLKGIVPE